MASKGLQDSGMLGPGFRNIKNLVQETFQDQSYFRGSLCIPGLRDLLEVGLKIESISRGAGEN